MLDIGPAERHELALVDSGGAEACATRFRRVSEIRLASFYFGLSFEQRLERFGTPSTDCSIRAWRATIDRDYYLPITLERGRRLAGLVELFGSRTNAWKRPELALTVGWQDDAPRLRQRLMVIGLGAARDLGAVDVFMNFNRTEISAAKLFPQYGGTLDHESGIAIIPCDFARSTGHEDQLPMAV